MSSKASYQNEPSPAKKQQLAELIELLQQYENIGISKVENIASKTIQRLRHNLRGEAKLKVAKNTLMKLAIEELAKKDKGLKKLIDYIQGSCAFILTNGNPFKVANYLDKNKIPTPAKEGQIAPKQVTVTARDTGFAPGPVIGELQSIGLQTRIESGTIKITQDAVVCEKDEKVSRTLANVLNRLGIEPFDAGLTVEVMYSQGDLIEQEDLIVDFDEILDNLVQARRDALTIALEAAIPTKDNIVELIARTRRQALSLALESTFITPETASNILIKTQLEALTLAQAIASKDPEALPPEVLSTAQTTSATTTTPETKNGKADEEDEEDEDAGMALFG
jgi:large subunit ribosomal protein L10